QLRIPVLRSPLGKAGEAVRLAIAIGYRHFDCAHVYENEEEIGDAIQKKIREQSVLWCMFHEKSLVKGACERTLASLKVDYLDLYLMLSLRWRPIYGMCSPERSLFPEDENGILPSDTDFLDTWDPDSVAPLLGCLHCFIVSVILTGFGGLVKSTGMSNFNCAQMERLLKKPGLKYKPVNHQIESHPYLPQEELLHFCQSKGISVTAYRPLGAPNWPREGVSLLNDPKVKEIAAKHNKTPAQVLICFQIQRHVSVIPRSVTPSRIKENFEVHLKPCRNWGRRMPRCESLTLRPKTRITPAILPIFDPGPTHNGLRLHSVLECRA
uniref:NADP-dependent oxidoreductase domain-containing protein n=1 Tax=Varanus komodoensis TaxID=61221 RepID=A0A8D2L2E6_VARKO